MPKNNVQFQKGFSWCDFNRRFGTEQRCWLALYRLQFPQGFVCKRCQATAYYRIKRRQCLQCVSCKRQYSLRAGTMMAYSKISLKQWFMALYLITQSKKSLSSLALMRYLGLSYNSAWLLQQKIIHALKQDDEQYTLTGVIHVDDGYLGGYRSGIRGRGAEGKTPFITALSFYDNKPFHIKLSPIEGFSKAAIRAWSARFIAEGSLVFSDALQGFQAIARPGVQHKAINITDDSKAKDTIFAAINTMMGNLKRYVLGIHHAIRPRSLKRYLAAFSWRFNHRFDLKKSFDAAVAVMVQATPCTASSLQDVASR